MRILSIILLLCGCVSTPKMQSVEKQYKHYFDGCNWVTEYPDGTVLTTNMNCTKIELDVHIERNNY